MAPGVSEAKYDVIRYIYGLEPTANVTNLFRCEFPPDKNVDSPGITALQAVIVAGVLVNSLRMGLDFSYQVEHRRNIKFLIIGSLIQFLLVPAIGLFLVWLFKDLMTGFQQMSILCITVCPGGLLSTGLAEKVGSSEGTKQGQRMREKSARISTFTCFYSWIITPVLLMLVSMYIDSDLKIFTDLGRFYLAGLIGCFGFGLAPITLGIFLRRRILSKLDVQKIHKIQKLLVLLEFLLTIANVVLVLPLAKRYTTKYIITLSVCLPFLLGIAGYFFAAICHSIMLKFNCAFNFKHKSSKIDPITEYTTFALTAGIQNNRIAMIILMAWSFWSLLGHNCPMAFLHVAIGPALYGLSQILTGVIVVLTNNTRKRNAAAEVNEEIEITRIRRSSEESLKK